MVEKLQGHTLKTHPLIGGARPNSSYQKAKERDMTDLKEKKNNEQKKKRWVTCHFYTKY